MCTDARAGGLSGRRGGWEEEELVFGGRGFLGRMDGREGFEMSPAFTSSPTHTKWTTTWIYKGDKVKTSLHTSTQRHTVMEGGAAATELNL